MKLDPPLDTDFPLWDKAVLVRAMLQANVEPTKKLTRELFRAAQKWLPYEIRKAPWGNYWFLFTVEMEMERRWNFREFREGRRFGKNTKEPFRDANPYDHELARSRSWDRGYILGLNEIVTLVGSDVMKQLKAEQGK